VWAALRDERFAERARALRVAARRVRHADPEGVHDVRVAARRLEAALALWAPTLDRPAARRARRTLVRLRRALAPARDLEVQADWFAEAFGAEAAAGLGRWWKRLDRRRVAARGRAARRMRGERVRRVLRRVSRVTAGDETTAAFEAARARLERYETRLARRIERALETPEASRLHRARIALKRLRYAREVATWRTPVEAEEQALHAAQRALGEVQDRAVLIRVVQRRAKRWRRAGRAPLADALAPLASRLAAERSRAEAEALNRLRALRSSWPRSAAPRARAFPASVPAAALAVAPPTAPVAAPPSSTPPATRSRRGGPRAASG
jgi:CHAD domain-containing protein